MGVWYGSISMVVKVWSLGMEYRYGSIGMRV